MTIMAEETQQPAVAAATTEEVVVVTEKETPRPPAEEGVVTVEEVSEKPKEEVGAEESVAVAVKETETVAVGGVTEEVKIIESASFKEESNVVGELPDPQKKALDELKLLIQEALNKHEFTAAPAPAPVPEPEPVKEEEKKAEGEEPKPAAEAEIKKEKGEEPKPVTEPETVELPPSQPPVQEEAKVEEVVVPKVEEPPKEKVVETAAAEVVDEDGAKTVEAIEETIVSVASASVEAVKEEGETEEAVVAVVAEEVKVEEAAAPAAPPPPPEEVFIWGIPILGDERSDVILLKFLRARDFKVKEALAMIKNTVRWRKEFGIDSLLEENLGNELEKVVFTHGVDKEGHPVCYNVYGAFQDKELYQNCFSDDEKRKKFLRWRIQFLEKSIRKLDFSPDGVCTILQVNDLNNSPVMAKRELRQTTNQALTLLQDNYPEFVFKQVFINVPWWYLAFNKMISPFLTQRTKSKFVFAGPSRSAQTLFKYIAPEQVPVQFGGLSREGEQEFTLTDSVTEVVLKPTSKHTIELPASEKCTAVWELRVVGWEVNYGAEFVPSAEDGYTVIVSKARKLISPDEPIISETFKIGEPGKIVLTIDNQTSKKKKLLYRTKTKPLSD